MFMENGHSDGLCMFKGRSGVRSFWRGRKAKRRGEKWFGRRGSDRKREKHKCDEMGENWHNAIVLCVHL